MASMNKKSLQINSMRLGSAGIIEPESCQAMALPHEEIVRHIRANLTRRITLDEIAGIAELSVFQLVRAFRREAETTPYRLVLDLRLEHAMALLATGESIADAASCAGFADQSHLTRHLRRRTGFTPRRYLRTVRAAA